MKEYNDEQMWLMAGLEKAIGLLEKEIERYDKLLQDKTISKHQRFSYEEKQLSYAEASDIIEGEIERLHEEWRV